MTTYIIEPTYPRLVGSAANATLISLLSISEPDIMTFHMPEWFITL